MSEISCLFSRTPDGASLHKPVLRLHYFCQNLMCCDHSSDDASVTNLLVLHKRNSGVLMYVINLLVLLAESGDRHFII
jgi:hypothetical protein